MAESWPALWLTLKLAGITSIVLLVIATPLAWWLANWRHPLKPVVQAIIALPLVLPPTVLGFYLLIAFAPDSLIGGIWQSVFGTSLAFSFSGLVVGSLIYSLPFAVQPMYSGFSQLNREVLESARLLHLPVLTVATKIVFPLCKPAFIVALGLSFAHTLGEFGVVLMIGGNIPGETKVLSIALYDYVETLQYANAHALAGGLLVFSFVMLAVLYLFNPAAKKS